MGQILRYLPKSCWARGLWVACIWACVSARPACAQALLATKLWEYAGGCSMLDRAFPCLVFVKQMALSVLCVRVCVAWHWLCPMLASQLVMECRCSLMPRHAMCSPISKQQQDCFLPTSMRAIVMSIPIQPYASSRRHLICRTCLDTALE